MIRFHETFRSVALAGALTLGGAGLASAQSADAGARAQRHGECAHRGRGHRMFGRALRQLDLSDAQKGQVRSIMQDARQNRRSLRELEPEQRRAAMQDLREDTLRRVRAVLSAPQRARFDQIRAAHAQRRAERAQSRGQRGRGQGHQK